MIYLDNAATTPLCDAAKKAIIEHLDCFGNPSSSYELGRQSRLLIEDARERIAKCINAEPEEIYFTSGGSESNTWALNNYITVASGIEHHSVKPQYTQCVANIKDGVVDPQCLCFINHRYPKMFEMVSCMYVNNELGTIQPIKQIAEIAHGKGMLFHTDSVQAMGHVPIDIKEIDCDLLSASAHKFGGMKGVGFLFVKKGNNMYRIIDLFAGIGGIRLGFEQGFDNNVETVFTSEWDKKAQETYAANFKDSNINGDITKINENDIPSFDICLAGFPCQAFSSVGLRQGFKDKIKGTIFFDDFVIREIPEK